MLIAKKQQHDSARETDLQFTASPFETLPQYVLGSSLLSTCINFISRTGGAKKKVLDVNPIFWFGGP